MINYSGWKSGSSRLGDAWFPVGRVTSFPDINGEDKDNLAEPRLCNSDLIQGCKVFHVPRENSADATELRLEESEVEGLKDQVIVFQWKGKFFAVNHECPHASYPLSNGTPFDIEDFGMTLSSGITCPKHGWSFDLHTGKADRGNHKLNVWEADIRPIGNKSGSDDKMALDEKEVWVRRKQRNG